MRDAMRITKATCRPSSLYQRVDRYRQRKAEEELMACPDYLIEKGGTGFEGIIAGIHRERCEQSLGQAAAVDPCGVEVSPAVQSLVSSVSLSSSSSSLSALLKSRIEAGIESFPSWMKRDQARADLSRKARKNLSQAHLSRLVKKVNKVHYRAKHVAAHKTATLAIKTPESANAKQ